MSILTYNFESEYLKNNQAVTVILPDKPRSQTPAQFYRNGRKYKVLWLLHGTYGDHTDWVRKTNIEMYATERNLVVVMPSALNSNYSNWPGFMMGYDMYSYFTEELMPLVYGWLPVSDKRGTISSPVCPWAAGAPSSLPSIIRKNSRQRRCCRRRRWIWTR